MPTSHVNPSPFFPTSVLDLVEINFSVFQTFFGNTKLTPSKFFSLPPGASPIMVDLGPMDLFGS